MDLKQLKYFISIADFGSMTRASESLNIAQPALTQQVAKLEADLRTRVFDRSTSGVKLTPAGAVLYRYAKSIISRLMMRVWRYRTKTSIRPEESPSFLHIVSQ